MSYSKEERQEYQKRYRAKQKEYYIQLLGGACAECGETKNLEFDHIDRTTKSFTISGFNHSKEKTLKELRKCQLLCEEHHQEKSSKEESQKRIGKRLTPAKHGTLTEYMKYKCRCSECKAHYSEYKHKRRVERGWS